MYSSEQQNLCTCSTQSCLVHYTTVYCRVAQQCYTASSTINSTTLYNKVTVLLLLHVHVSGGSLLSTTVCEFA